MRRLYELEPAEVSLVPKGANKRKFLIFKSKNGVEMAQPDKELLELVKKADPKVLARVEKIIKDAKAEDGTGGVSPRAEAALKAVVRILMPFKGEINDDMLDQVLGEAGFGEMEDRDGGPADEGSPMEGAAGDEVEKECTPEAMEKAQKAASKAYMTQMKKMGYQKYPALQMQMKSVNKEAAEGDGADGDDEEEEEVEKAAILKADGSLDLSAVPAEVRPAVEAIYKGNQELVKKNADLEAQIKEERDQRKNREIVQKAETFKHLGLPKEDIVAQLKDAEAAGKESYERICKNFETLNTQAEKSKLFVEIGSSQSNAGGGNDAYAKIQAAVDGIVAKSDGKVSTAEAEERFLRTTEGQKMYAEYKNQRVGGI